MHGQRIDTLPSPAKQQYLHHMKKRSANKTIGWVLLGAGATLAGGYFLANAANGWNGHNKGEGMFEVGVGTAVLSAPFFVMAGANRRKAKLSLKGEGLTSLVKFRKPYFPAFSISVDL